MDITRMENKIGICTQTKEYIYKAKGSTQKSQETWQGPLPVKEKKKDNPPERRPNTIHPPHHDTSEKTLKKIRSKQTSHTNTYWNDPEK